MELRLAREEDYIQLAEMKWLHGEEDDVDYKESNLIGVDKELFFAGFAEFLKQHNEYKICVAMDQDIVASAMFVYMLPKVPKPGRETAYIAYLTNVYTRKEYRNQKVGTALLEYVKEYLSKEKCELIFAWPSENSVNWYQRNGFCKENEVFECVLEEG